MTYGDFETNQKLSYQVNKWNNMHNNQLFWSILCEKEGPQGCQMDANGHRCDIELNDTQAICRKHM